MKFAYLRYSCFKKIERFVQASVDHYKKEKELSFLLAELRKHFPILEEKYHISTLEVFGSYIRREQGKASDLDLLVTFSKLPSLFTFIEIENYLSDLLGVQVDLVMRDALKPAVGERILREALPI